MVTEPVRSSGWTRRRFLATTASAAAAATLAACSLDQSTGPDDTSRSTTKARWAGELQSPPLEKPTVTFTDMDGNSFPFRERTEGKLALLFFGYTSCPDVCPVTLNLLANAIDSLAGGSGSDPMVLFVGVDVARDTPEQMRDYLGSFNPTFLGLTGTEKVIAQANREMFLPPIVLEEPDADGNYIVGHGKQVFAFTADNVAHRFYPGDTVRQEQWVHDLPLLAKGVYR